MLQKDLSKVELIHYCTCEKMSSCQLLLGYRGSGLVNSDTCPMLISSPASLERLQLSSPDTICLMRFYLTKARRLAPERNWLPVAMTLSQPFGAGLYCTQGPHRDS